MTLISGINFKSLSQQSKFMAELIYLSNGKCDLKLHSGIKNFKRVEKFNYKRNFFRIYLDKNDSVYDIKRCEVISWKLISKGKGKVKVPDQINEVRDIHLFNKIHGNPFKIATTKITAEIDIKELL